MVHSHYRGWLRHFCADHGFLFFAGKSKPIGLEVLLICQTDIGAFRATKFADAKSFEPSCSFGEGKGRGDDMSADIFRLRNAGKRQHGNNVQVFTVITEFHLNSSPVSLILSGQQGGRGGCRLLGFSGCFIGKKIIQMSIDLSPVSTLILPVISPPVISFDIQTSHALMHLSRIGIPYSPGIPTAFWFCTVCVCGMSALLTEIRTECVIDVVQATAYLGQAVVFLYKAGWLNSDTEFQVTTLGFLG